MNPEADDLYECLDVEPVTNHSELIDKITWFKVDYGEEYPAKLSEIERKLKDPESRREYNNNNDYPTNWEDVGEIVTLQVEGPEIVEKGEGVTIRVTDEEGSPESDAAVSIGGADAGTTGPNGYCSFALEDIGTWTITASKPTSGEVRYEDGEHDIEITSERRELSATADPSTIRVGESVTVTATDAEGRVKDAVVKFPTGSQRTDSSGNCTTTLNSADEYEVAVQKEDDDEVTYVATSVTITVEPKHVVLNIAPDTTEATVGDSLGVTVTDEAGDFIEDVTVSASGRSATTNGDGRASVELTEVGTVTVEASKADESNRTYTDAETTVSVDHRERNLSVETEGSVEVGDDLSVTVTDDTGDTVGNCTVEVPERGLSETTDGTGTCHLTFSEPGDVILVATKGTTSTTEYTKDTAEVTVKQASRRLQVSPVDTTVEVETPVEFQVTDDAGNGVSDATVEAPSGTYRTDDEGTCTVVFETVGDFDIPIERSDTDTVTYTGTEASVTVERRHISLSVVPESETVEPGAGVWVVVRDDRGERVPDAEVRCSGERKTTNDRGRCSVHPSTEGSTEIRVDKEDEAAVIYDEDTATVEVVLEERTLEITAPDTAVAGGSVTVEVSDGTGPVAGAVVTSPLDEDATDGSGTATVSLPSTSVANLSVRKPAADGIKYRSDTARIELKPAPDPAPGLDPDDDDSGESTDGLGTVELALSVLGILALPIGIGVFVLFPGSNMVILVGVVLLVNLAILFGLTRSRSG